MPTQTNNPSGLEKRREQNRLAQQRFRQKHRLRGETGQRESSTLPQGSTTSEGEQETQTEDDTLTRFLSASELSTTSWTMDSSDHVTHASFGDPIIDVNFNDASESNEAFLASNGGEDADSLDLSGRYPGSSWQSSLHIAVQKGHTKIVELLLKHKADCNQRDSQGLTSLMHATIKGYDDIADLLLSNGAGIECVNNLDQSALHLAVLYCRDRLLRKLLQHCKGDNSVVNGYTRDGKTPLHIAIDVGFEAAVELLLESGADVQCRARTSEVWQA